MFLRLIPWWCRGQSPTRGRTFCAARFTNRLVRCGVVIKNSRPSLKSNMDARAALTASPIVVTNPSSRRGAESKGKTLPPTTTSSPERRMEMDSVRGQFQNAQLLWAGSSQRSPMTFFSTRRGLNTGHDHTGFAKATDWVDAYCVQPRSISKTGQL